ncbi:MAG: VOC family protein [Proteobacteria bacterium]|nr:VOC family protein [Pseudomonadota bacterium]
MKFDHVHIKCRDLDKAVEYYERIFGARVFARDAVGGVSLIRLNLGGTVLNLSGVGKEESLPEPPGREKLWPQRGLGHFGLVVDDLEKTVQEMKAKGADFFVEPREAMPGTRIAFVKGPDEDVIELIQREKPLAI